MTSTTNTVSPHTTYLSILAVARTLGVDNDPRFPNPADALENYAASMVPAGGGFKFAAREYLIGAAARHGVRAFAARLDVSGDPIDAACDAQDAVAAMLDKLTGRPGQRSLV